MADLMELSQDRRLRNHFNIDKKRRSNSHKQTSPHFHSYYELYFMQEGSCRFFVLDTAYHLRTGDFILVPPGTYHIVSYEEKGLHDRFALYFDDERVDPSLSPFLTGFLGQETACHRHLPHESVSSLLSLLNQMLELYVLNNEYGEKMLEYLFPVFLLFLTRNMTLPAEYRQGKHTDEAVEAVTAVTRYLASHFTENLSLSETARMAGFTPTYFSRKFKEIVGIGFRDYLTHIRLREAERLLRTTSLPVQEVSVRSGFAGANYFGDVFTSVYGLSPRAFRKRENPSRDSMS